MREKMNMELPIFIHYIKGDNISRQNASEKIDSFKKYYNSIGLQTIIVASDRDEIKVLWPGNKSNYSKTEKGLELLERINNTQSDSEILGLIRDFKLNNLLYF